MAQRWMRKWGLFLRGPYAREAVRLSPTNRLPEGSADEDVRSPVGVAGNKV